MLSNILSSLRQSWQSDLGGVGATKQVEIILLSREEAITNSSAIDGKSTTATRINYLVLVDKQGLDQHSQIPYKYELVLNRFSQFTVGSVSLCSFDYSYSLQFRIVLGSKICGLVLPSIAASARDWFAHRLNQQQTNIDVRIPISAVEEMVDDNFNLFYSLPVYVWSNRESLSPDKATQRKLADFLRKTPINKHQLNVVDDTEVRVYRVAQAFTYYVSFKMSKTYLENFAELFKQALERFDKLTFANTQVTIKLQQDVLFYK